MRHNLNETLRERRPIIGITMGDPASIGPELSIRVLASEWVYDEARPLIVGDAVVLQEARKMLGLEDIAIRPIEAVSEARFVHGTIDVLDLGLVDTSALRYGQISATTGEASYRYIERVISLALSGKIDATVTNAISKEALNMAGYKYSGHTEIYAAHTKTSKYTMLLVHDNLRVVHVSTHVSLRRACDLVRRERVLEVIGIADAACKDMGIECPRIGVAGLNPHSGENGMFGYEELEEIIPAIEAAKTAGMSVDGPLPPDTVFPKARGGWYDIVVAMYHDQGHIPLKLEGFVYDKTMGRWQTVSGVNITLGLPVIRTSVDHGTAMDQAFKGTASDASLASAIRHAISIANRKISEEK